MLPYDEFALFSKGALAAMKNPPKQKELSDEFIRGAQTGVLKTLYVLAAVMATHTDKTREQVFKDCGLPKHGKDEEELLDKLVANLTFRAELHT